MLVWLLEARESCREMCVCICVVEEERERGYDVRCNAILTRSV